MTNATVATDKDYRWEASFLISTHRGGNGIVFIGLIDDGRRSRLIFTNEGFERQWRRRFMSLSRRMQIDNGEIRVADKHVITLELWGPLRDARFLSQYDPAYLLEIFFT